MRVRACETLRAAIAKATRLRAAAEAAAIEATSDSDVNKGSKSQSNEKPTTHVASPAAGSDTGIGSDGVGGTALEKPSCGPSLSRIIECRTQAEHKAIAVACSHLRASVDLPPVTAAAAGPALLPSSRHQGGGGNASSVVTSRASFSGGGSHASSTHGGDGAAGGLSGRLSGRASSRHGDNFNGSPRAVATTTVPALWVALDALVGQGGPWSGLQTPSSSSSSHLQGGVSLMRDYDGVNGVDPTQVGEFAGALSVEQVGRSTQLSICVAESASEF